MKRALLLGLAVALGACGGPKAINVTEREKLGASWDCAAPESCTQGYLAFLTAAADHARPLSEGALDQQLAQLDAGTVAIEAGPVDAGVLGAEIVDALGVGFLREGLDARPLLVTTTAKSQTDTYVEHDLLLEDPYVGTLKAILLEPKTGGPFPAVVALHGHGDSAEVFRDSFGGAQYPAHGYAILMLTSRAMNIDADEHAVSRALLLQGFTLMGLRTYEALLALKYLRSRSEIAPGRVGLIGHSGGSSTGNLLIRFEPGFSAFVTDHQVDWFSSGVGEPYHCETVPALYPLGGLVNDYSTSATPVREEFYGYPLGFDLVFKFFDHYLKKP